MANVTTPPSTNSTSNLCQTANNAESTSNSNAVIMATTTMSTATGTTHDMVIAVQLPLSNILASMHLITALCMCVCYIVCMCDYVMVIRKPTRK